jgi:RecB family endonuclease NucS
MTEHDRMVGKLWRNPCILATALDVDRIWIRAKEYPIDKDTSEAADLVFQDGHICSASPDTTCFVLELKSSIADHEVIGQLNKAVNHLEKRGKTTNRWNNVIGVAIAKKFTKSGLDLLNDKGYVSFMWMESNDNVSLRRVE